MKELYVAEQGSTSSSYLNQISAQHHHEIVSVMSTGFVTVTFSFILKLVWLCLLLVKDRGLAYAAANLIAAECRSAACL